MKTGLYVLLLSLGATVAVGTDSALKTPVYLEGTFTFEVVGPGAAPYGITSGLLGAMGIGINLGRLERMQLPINPGLDADEHTRIDIDFKLIAKSNGRWQLHEYSVHHTAEDYTTLQEEDIRIADSITSSDEARFSDGKWVVAPEGIPADFEPKISLKTWQAKSAEACESGPGWLPSFLRGTGEVLCYELKLDLIYPVAPTGVSEWTKGNDFGVRLSAQNGIYRFSVEAPEVPDFTGMLPNKEQSVEAMEAVAGFFSELIGQATGSTPEQPTIDPSQVQDVQKDVKDLLRGVDAMMRQFDHLELDLRGGHSLQRTWRGVADKGLIRIDDIYPILSGGEASDLGRLPILLPILEKIDAAWLPEDGNDVEVKARFDGAAVEPAHWRFELIEVSREPGTCINSPQSSTDPDLYFDDTTNTAMGFTSAQQLGEIWRIETTRPLEVATPRIVSRDYAAWGKLKAWVKMGDDWQPVAVEGSELDYITIPVDESGGENYIADSWEQSEGLSPGLGHRTDDDEKGPKNSHRGDGLSLYEEYRGAFVKGDHVRMKPDTKDLFLHIQPGSGMDGWGRYFSEATQTDYRDGAAVHEVRRAELNAPGSHFVVNRNSSPERRRTDGHQQHGKYVRALTREQLGGMCGKAGLDDITVNIADTPMCKNDETFVHEIMHTLSVIHHGLVWHPNGIEVCEVDGKYYPDCEKRPGRRSRKEVAYWDGPYSGDQWCFMAYHGAYGFMISRSFPAKPALTSDGALIKSQYPDYTTRICTSPKGTEYNADGKQVNGAQDRLGNCWDQIRIRDED
jgi:hypothetical protein